MSIKFLPIIAGMSGLGASVEGGLPADSGTFEAIGRWPLTVILGAVCVTCVYFMYRQSRDNADRVATTAKDNCSAVLALVEGERIATEKRIASNALVTKELAENNAKVVRELAENHAKELRTLLDEIGKKP